MFEISNNNLKPKLIVILLFNKFILIYFDILYKFYFNKAKFMLNIIKLIISTIIINFTLGRHNVEIVDFLNYCRTMLF
jgi:hypothetical protein